MEYPIYNAVLKEEEDGIFSISLVDSPATFKPAMLFKKDNEYVQFAVQNEDKHLISGVIMVASTPIYRRNGDFEYYVQYEPSTLALMAERMLKNGYQNQVDLQHNGKYVDGVSLVELYIKDSAKGINPNFIEDIPDGSLMGTYKCENEEVWNKMKSGELTGFSLAGLFSLEETDMIIKYNKVNKRKLTMSKLKEKLKALLQEFASIDTNKGTLNYEGELEVGTEVFDEFDNPIADGEYETEDKVIVVAEGKITEIRDKEVAEEPAAEEAPAVEAAAEEPAAEEPVAEEPAVEEPNEIDAIKADIEAIKADIEAIKNSIAEISNEPMTEPVTEQFEAVTKIVSTGDKKLDNLMKIVNAKRK